MSDRTHREYELAFGCVAQLYQKLFKTPLRVDAVLGDAEDAQFNALRSVGVFSEAKDLMCFFTSFTMFTREHGISIPRLASLFLRESWICTTPPATLSIAMSRNGSFLVGEYTLVCDPSRNTLKSNGQRAVTGDGRCFTLRLVMPPQITRVRFSTPV